MRVIKKQRPSSSQENVRNHSLFSMMAFYSKPVLHLLFPPLKFSISYKCMRWKKNTFLGRKSYFASSRYTLLAKSEPQSYSQHNTYLFQHDFLYIYFIKCVSPISQVCYLNQKNRSRQYGPILSFSLYIKIICIIICPDGI